MNDETISFGAWVKRRRQALRLTQDALAERVVCSVDLIRKVEADSRRPSQEIAERLARQLGLANHQWATFVKVARGELRADWLPAAHEVAEPLTQSDSAALQNTLPAATTPLIGRQQELHELRARLLSREVRLITLLGAPGIGKTRLSLELATTVRSTFADDVCFVALAPIRDAELVAAAIVQALGVQELGGQPLTARLKQALRDRQMLLVLDNFEHLIAAAPLVAELLAAAPGLKVLATSRAALHVSGEHEYEVSPLALPNLDQLPSDDPTLYAAIHLFVQRAQAVAPAFVLTDANAAAVAAICRHLDGLPLALELAAARIKLLTPAALLGRLERRLSLLTGGARDLPPHQQTLRSAIDWSYDLLNASEQALFRRLAVFMSGCTLEAAEAVASLDAPAAERSTMLDGLAALLDKSLLRQQGDDDARRFSMLETMREYALERLEQHGEAETLRQRHAAYYLALVEEATPHLMQSEQGAQGEWLSRLDSEHNNLRAALGWSASTDGAAAIGLRLVAALWRFWLVRSHLSEGRTWLQTHLERTAPSQTTSAARASAFIGLGTLGMHQNDYTTARRAFDEALAIARERDDHESVIQARYNLGIIASFQGDYTLARDQLEACLTWWQKADDANGCASALQSLGDIAWHQGDYAAAHDFHAQSFALRSEIGQDIDIFATGNLHNLGRIARVEGDFAQATTLCEASLALARKRGFRPAELWALHDLGEIARDQQQYAQALMFYEQSLAIAQEISSPAWRASLLNRIAEVAQAQGDFARASALQRESLHIFHGLGQKRDILLCLEALARLAEAQNQFMRSAVLYGAVAALREATGARIPPLDRASYARSLERVQACLAPAELASAQAEGIALPLAQAIAYALEVCETTEIADLGPRNA